MRTKKYLAWLLVGAVCASTLLAGCGKKKEAEKKEIPQETVEEPEEKEEVKMCIRDSIRHGMLCSTDGEVLGNIWALSKISCCGCRVWFLQ